MCRIRVVHGSASACRHACGVQPSRPVMSDPPDRTGRHLSRLRRQEPHRLERVRLVRSAVRHPRRAAAADHLAGAQQPAAAGRDRRGRGAGVSERRVAPCRRCASAPPTSTPALDDRPDARGHAARDRRESRRPPRPRRSPRPERSDARAHPAEAPTPEPTARTAAAGGAHRQHQRAGRDGAPRARPASRSALACCAKARACCSPATTRPWRPGRGARSKPKITT